jgi:hypothetical protein
LTLLGRDINIEAIRPGGVLPVTLYWRANAEMKINYTTFIQLLDQQERVVAQVDQYPLDGAAPTSTWLPSEILTDHYQLLLPDLPAGEYRLIVGLYNAATGQRLPAEGGSDFVELDRISIS